MVKQISFLATAGCLWVQFALQPTYAQDVLHGTSWSVTDIAVSDEQASDGSLHLQSIADEMDIVGVLNFERLSGLVAESPLASTLESAKGELVANMLPCLGIPEYFNYQIDMDSNNLWITHQETCLGCATPKQVAEDCAEYGRAETKASQLAVAFVDNLYQVDTFFMSDDGARMELLDAKDRVLIELISCQDESDLAGTAWHPTAIHTQSNGTISPLCMIDPWSIYAKFDGCSIHGRGGCNQYWSFYKTRNESKLSVEGTSMTTMYCLGSRWDIESHFHRALHQATLYEIDTTTDTLEAFDLNGTELVSFVPCVDLNLTGVIWETHCIRYSCRNTGEKAIRVEFGSDNILRGNSKCTESFALEYKAYANGSITFKAGEWDATACEPDTFEEDYHYENALEDEEEFPLALAEAAQFALIPCSDTLMVFDKEGDTLFAFRGLLSDHEEDCGEPANTRNPTSLFLDGSVTVTAASSSSSSSSSSNVFESSEFSNAASSTVKSHSVVAWLSAGLILLLACILSSCT